jgi:hypothetical protein
MSNIEDHHHCPVCSNILDEIAEKEGLLESFTFLLCRGNVNHLYRVRSDIGRLGSPMALVDEYSLKYARKRIVKLEKELKKAKKK